MNTIDENHYYLKSALLALLSALTLAGCGDGSNFPRANNITTQPISVVLKPGETERVQITSESKKPQSYEHGFSPAGEITETAVQACITSDPKCQIFDFEAASSETSNLLSFLVFNYINKYRLHDQSSIPFSTFPTSTQTLPPAIRFAAGGKSYDNGLIRLDGFSLAVTADGSTWAWGINDSGQLGNGSVKPSSVPRQVQHTGSFAAIAAGGAHAMAIETDGSVWTWGDNSSGQLGAVTGQDENPLPVQALNLTNIIAIAAGESHSLALDANGNVWSWGSDGYGQLGRGSFSKATTPQQLTDLNDIVAIAAGDSHSLALDDNGRIWAWGKNWDGQVAGRGKDGKPRTQSNPTMIQNLGSFSTIAAGGGYSLAVTSDGRVMSWGSNTFGQLGRISSSACNLAEGFTCSIDAAPVTGLDQVLDVAAGSGFAIARLIDGSVWAWGNNESGQVAGIPGLATSEARPVKGLNSILRIEAGSGHAIAMSSDDACSVGSGRTGGKLMAWGDNIFGARGDGTGANWIKPTPVLSIGDDNSCAGLKGHRIIIYKAGTGNGTIESDIPGMNCTGIICWQSVAAGADVTLTATPDASSEFTDWSWDCSAQTSSITMTADSAKVCKIHFNQTLTIVPPVPPTPEPAACNDGIDNDDDGLIDLSDTGCSSADDNSEIDNTGSIFSLTINITGSGEVFDNNDDSFFCYSDSNASCVQSYPANGVASLRGISFDVENLALWSNECDNGYGALDSCTINMDRDRTVTINMQ